MNTQSIRTVLLVCIGVIAGFILVEIGIYVGRLSAPQVSVLPAHNTITASPSPVPTLPVFADEQKSCDMGTISFENGHFSLCYPDHLTRRTEASASSQIFSSETEELIVEKNSERKWGIHLCNLKQETMVANHPATRVMFREPLESGCGDTIGYGTLITTGQKKPFIISFYKTEGFFDGPSQYEAIEQSLQIKQ